MVRIQEQQMERIRLRCGDGRNDHRHVDHGKSKGGLDEQPAHRRHYVRGGICVSEGRLGVEMRLSRQRLHDGGMAIADTECAKCYAERNNRGHPRMQSGFLRCVPTEEKLTRKIAQWQTERNEEKAKINWGFAVRDARKKFTYDRMKELNYWGTMLWTTEPAPE
jgi:hypothetical protein